VNNDVWSPIPGWKQTLTSFGPGSWQVVANMPAGNTAIVSYPDVQQPYNDVKLSSYTSMTSSFTENMNANPGTVGEAAWDIWLTNWNYEVMIWVDNYGQDIANSDGTLLGTTSIGGQTWDVYRNGPLGPGVELIVALDHNEQSGTVDIMSTLNYLQQHGWLPSNATLTAVDFGAEFASTGGKNETFQVSNYTINAKS
jgi:Glycosyl hydrolase family 12